MWSRVVCYGSRVVVPIKACRKTLLEELHLGHPGIVRMIMKALGTVPATGNVKMKRVRTRLVAKLKRVCVHHAQVMLNSRALKA